MIIQIEKMYPSVKLPGYATEYSAGMDLHAYIPETRWTAGGYIDIGPSQRVVIHTGIRIALPTGTFADIRPRSGLALKHGITVLNTPGTIDSDYRGEIGVLLINTSNETYRVNNNDRIAQLIVLRYWNVEWKETKGLDETERNEGGFGSTDADIATLRWE